MARAQYDPTRAAGSCSRCSQTVDKTKRGHRAPKNIPVSRYGIYSRHQAFALSRQYVAGAICTCIAGEGTTRGEGKGITLVVNNCFEVYVCLGSISRPRLGRILGMKLYRGVCVHCQCQPFGHVVNTTYVRTVCRCGGGLVVEDFGNETPIGEGVTY